MKKFYILIFSLLFACQIKAQSYWPHGTPFPTCNSMPSNCTKVAVGGNWNSAGSWSPAGVPTNNQIVCVPTGVTITVSGTINAPRLQIFVCGTLDFDQSPPGKLQLADWSFIQVLRGGLINARNGDAELISIGGNEVWRHNNNDVNGPWILSWPYIGGGVLPVKLGSFKAEQVASNQIQLSWSTYFEQNSREFQIERSADNTNWTTIGSTPAKGNSSGLSSYTFFDKTPFNGTNFYRLRQVDVDDHFVFSEIVRATTESQSGIRVFPNPATTSTQIYLGHGSNRNQLIQIINSNGALVQQLNMGIGNVLTVSTSSLAPGTYLVRVVEQGKTQQQTTLVKQ